MDKKWIKNTSVTKLARRAGIKSLAESSYQTINDLATHKCQEVINVLRIVNANNNTKTITQKDYQTAMKMLGENVAFV